MNPQSPYAKVLIIDDNLISYVDDDLPEKEDDDAIYLNFKDCIITPGLIDSHNHLVHTGLGSLFTFNVSALGETNMDEIITKIEDFAEKSEFPWVLGSGINENRIEEKRLPTVIDLDQITTTKPVFITHNTVHYGICNGVALELASISEDTIDPVGGKIGRFPNGKKPNGILYEPAAMDLVRKYIPPFSSDQYTKAIREISKLYVKAGLTCVKDTGGTGADLDEAKRLEVLNALDERNELMIRQSICLPVFTLEDAKKKVELSKKLRKSEFLRFLGYKLFLDGSGFGRTVWMRCEWNKELDTLDKNNYGFPLWQIEEFARVLDYLADNNNSDGMISIHAIGDKAIDVALEKISRIKARCPNQRFSLIHVYAPDDGQLDRIRDLCVYVEFQTAFLYFYGDLLSNNLGRERSRRFMRAKSFLKKGMIVANSSDSPVIPFAPIYGIVSSMFRMTRGKLEEPQVFDLNETIGFEDALVLYTRNAAKCVGIEHNLGSLERGKIADFVVWKRGVQNLNSVDRIEDCVVATFIGGKQVYTCRA